MICGPRSAGCAKASRPCSAGPERWLKSRRRLIRASKEVDTIIATFDALLRIAQIEGGARKQNFCEVDLSAIVENLIAVYGSVAEDRGFSLEFAIEEGCLIRGDRDLLTQLVVNLIENALTHVPSPSTVSVTLRRAGNQCSCVIADRGPGIPKYEHEKVFRRLYRP